MTVVAEHGLRESEGRAMPCRKRNVSSEDTRYGMFDRSKSLYIGFSRSKDDKRNA